MSSQIENQIYRATVDFLGPLDVTKFACDNCDWNGTADQLDVVGTASLTPGHASPAGRCPECGALAYVIDSPHSQALAMLAALLPYATSRAEDMHAEGGDQCEYWQKADKAVSDTITMLRQNGIQVPGYTVNEGAAS